MAFLGIAAGAVKIGQKIFKGVKKFRNTRKAIRAARQDRRDAKLAKAEQTIFGTQGIIPDSGISQAGAGFQNLMNQAGFVDRVDDRESIRFTNQEDPEPGQNRIVLIIGGILLIVVLFGKKLFR